MIRKLLALALLVSLSSGAIAQQNMFLKTGQYHFQVTNTFSNVDLFAIHVEIDAPLAAGVYNNPDIVMVSYHVIGDLAPGTPSGSPAFDLQRGGMFGTTFYDQGGSLNFEISDTAVLSDGVQVSELVGDGIVLTFNGREIDIGSFHPALFELSANGTGRIQNSNNIPTLDPLIEVNFGEEYITDLMFDPGNTTVITDVRGSDIDTRQIGSGSINALDLLAMLTLMFFYRAKRKKNRANSE